MKKCLICELNKQLEFFGKDKRNIDGRQNVCKICINVQMRKRYAKITGRNLDQIRINNKNEYSGKIIDNKKLCSGCNEWENIENFHKTSINNCGLQSTCKKCSFKYTKIFGRMIKMEFLLAYGKVCECCGESKFEFLTIEHKRGYGKQLIYGYKTYELLCKLKKLGWPKEYGILCYNCNLSTKSTAPCMHNNLYKDFEIELENSIRSNEIRNKYFRLKEMLE